jgi:cytochrome o ubiquinol oxidase subunit IV
MSHATHTQDAHGHDDHGEAHGSRRTYVIGFLLSAVLTAIPFWMVMAGGFDKQVTIFVAVALAVVQILVHTFCFLHVNARAEGGWQLMAYAFTAVLVLIVIAGSLWIMYHLHTNMMPVAEMNAAP